MKNLVDIYDIAVNKGIPTVALAAWFHHAYVSIHPFQV
jgi:hypothetical protein